MNTAVSDFHSLCRQMGHPPPTFIKLNNQPKNRVALVVTIYGQQIVSARPEESYKAAKIALARKATHHLSGSQITMPQMIFDGGNANFGNNRQNISNASALQHQAASLAPVPHNVLGTHDQSYLEEHFRHNIVSQIGNGTCVRATAAADLMADILLRRPEEQTMECREAMRDFTERLAQRLNEGSS